MSELLDRRQKEVLEQAADILAGLGLSKLADTLSNVLKAPHSQGTTLTSASAATPQAATAGSTFDAILLPWDPPGPSAQQTGPDCGHERAQQNACPNIAWQNEGPEALATGSFAFPLADDGILRFDDMFTFGDADPAEVMLWEPHVPYWEGLDTLGTDTDTGAQHPSVPGSDSHELLSGSWNLLTSSTDRPPPQPHGEGAGTVGLSDQPVSQFAACLTPMRGEDPSADSACVEGREGSDDPQPTPALHLCGSAATLPDQFERARLHRKLVKRGHGGSKVVKRQPPADEVKKQQTAVTRQIRACIRCHLQRIRCFPSEEDPHGLCLTCELSKPTFCRLPCIRYKVTDVPLFRLGPSDNYIWTKRWLGKSLKDISKWASEDTTSILLTQDHGGTAINVSVKKFIPVYGDTLNYFWITGSGHKKTLGCTPFAIANLEQVSAEVKRHIKQSVTEHVATFTDNRTAILSKTFSMVMRTAEQANDKVNQKLLNEVLELWVASRLIEKPWRVQCGQLLGHILEDNHPFFDSESPYFGRIPVTPMMDQQLDQVVIKTALLPLKRSVQRSLRSLIEANKPDHWFTIYLCIFVLLSNYEIATQHDRGYAIRYSLQERFANYPLLQGFHTGAKTMLAHFHYCNKGGTPFQLDWSNTPAVVEWANLGSDQIAYMKDLVDTLKQECQDYKQLKRSRAYEVDGYLLSQLFDSSSEWQPEHML